MGMIGTTRLTTATQAGLTGTVAATGIASRSTPVALRSAAFSSALPSVSGACCRSGRSARVRLRGLPSSIGGRRLGERGACWGVSTGVRGAAQGSGGKVFFPEAVGS